MTVNESFAVNVSDIGSVKVGRVESAVQAVKVSNIWLGCVENWVANTAKWAEMMV